MGNNTLLKNMVDNNDTENKIIGKDEIVSRLKKYSNNPRVGLPGDIDFNIENGVLKVFVKKTKMNMQTDSAAFEAWILVLKAWLSNEIEHVQLDFTVPDDLTAPYGNSIAGHYNRFLYRLHNMLLLFPDWFSLHESKTKIVSDFMRWLQSGTCLLNHSLQERESVINTDKMERQIESWFAFHKGKELLCNYWGIDKEKLFNQLPIGLFYNEISSRNAIFTRGTSAVDLWGIGNDGETLHLIELKCGNNLGIGVIGELLFYTAVLYDTCLAKEKLFSFGRYGKAHDTRDMIAIQNDGINCTKLFAHILAERYHPLFTGKVNELIRSGLTKFNIAFNTATYNYSEKVFVDENNNL